MVTHQAARKLVPENPWKASRKELVQAANELFDLSLVIGRDKHLKAYDIELARMLIAVLQTRSLTRATYALVVVTAILVVATALLAFTA